jgi:hypothetical protein
VIPGIKLACPFQIKKCRLLIKVGFLKVFLKGACWYFMLSGTVRVQNT